MKKTIALFSAFALAVAALAAGAPSAGKAGNLRTRVIQPAYAYKFEDIEAIVQWELDELARCDESLDLIVLPEASDRQGRIGSPAELKAAVEKHNATLLKACSDTARRCKAIVFVNAIDCTPTGMRNTTFAYDRTGKLVDKYDKEHLVRSEHAKLKLDASYMWEWTTPKITVIDGVRFAYMTCYDFYFYENYANIARMKPDIIIGCSHQRSDRHDALETIGRFLAYNTCAYLVRSSVSMGLDSPLGGCSMIVSPMGQIIGNMRSRVGSLTVDIDPHAKYLKPAGYGNPPNTHPAYIEIGRRPWKYRPAGSAIIPNFSDHKGRRLCAHRGFSAVAPENSLVAFGAAVALGASEIELDVWPTKDGEIVTIHDATLDRVSDGKGKVYDLTYAELLKFDFGSKHGKSLSGLRIPKFEDVLRKFSCHTIMNVHVKSRRDQPWDEKALRRLIGLIDAYDARGHVYFMSENLAVQKQLAALAPDIPRCMGHDSRAPDQIVERAIAHGCKMVQFFKPHFSKESVDKAHAAGLRCNVFFANDAEEAKNYFKMGIDTVLTDDYHLISAATGVR
jgi:glycerophosphoryl diester phosphodiesterase/predicted amidohydrolase